MKIHKYWNTHILQYTNTQKHVSRLLINGEEERDPRWSNTARRAQAVPVWPMKRIKLGLSDLLVWENIVPVWETIVPVWETIVPVWENIVPVWKNIVPVWSLKRKYWDRLIHASWWDNIGIKDSTVRQSKNWKIHTSCLNIVKFFIQ